MRTPTGPRVRNILFLLMLFTVAPVAAKNQTVSTVPVVDATSGGWEAAITETIDDYNAIMPKHGPTLVYVLGETSTCNPNWWENQDIRVLFCHPGPGVIYGVLGTPWRAEVMTPTANLPVDKEWFLCHEFMHALTGIPDNYNSQPGKSCVYSYQDDPGSFDKKELAKAVHLLD